MSTPGLRSGSRISQPEFGRRLRALRLTRGISQRALAGDVVTPAYISLVEKGRRVPTLDVLVRLAETLGISMDEFTGAQAAASGAGDTVQQAVYAQVIARACLDAGDLEQARRHLEEAVGRLRENGTLDRFVQLCLDLRDVLTMMGDHAGTLRLITELRELPSVQKSPELQVIVLIDEVSTLRELGRLQDARTSAKQAVDRIDGCALRESSEHVRLLGVLVSVLCESGDFAQAEARTEEMLAMTAGLDNPRVAGRAHWAAGLAYARIGRTGDAHAQMMLAREHLPHPTMPIRDWVRFMRSMASILLDIRQDLPLARTYLEVAEISLQLRDLPGERYALTALRARYELQNENPAKAEEICRALLKDPGSPDGVCKVRIAFTLSQALRQLDRLDEAVTVLRTAADQCEEIGSYELAAKVWRRLDEMRS